jgi:hypothetical protein
LVQAFLKKWWVESDFKAPNLPLALRLKGSGCHYNSIYNNMIAYSYKNLNYLTLQSFDLGAYYVMVISGKRRAH